VTIASLLDNDLVNSRSMRAWTIAGDQFRDPSEAPLGATIAISNTRIRRGSVKTCIHSAAPERRAGLERGQTSLRIASISLSLNARIVVLLTLPAATTLAIAPIIASSEGASMTDTRS
jgi:hypothetical protein